jgi:light-regulated signal transduction histidine kinase (bacteriophytochrome)
MSSEPPVSILLVDDQPANLLTLEALLANLGQNLIKAHSGEEALRYLNHGEFAVVLLDLWMQGLSGFETAKRIRSRENSRYTPIIFLTAFESSEFPVREAYALGAVDYLVKPLVPVILRAKVAVFVELFQKSAQLKRQADQLRASENLIRSDIAVRKRAEADLKRTADELARSNRDLDQFASAASHDLKEPLRKIRIHLGLLNEGYGSQLDEKAREYLDRALESAGRMQTLVNDLLTYARVGTPGKTLEPVNCQTAFEQALANLETLIREKAAVVNVQAPLPTVRGSLTELVQLFQNLIENGIKFQRAGQPLVRVAAERAEGDWIISVHDNGIGIDVSYADRIFVIFQRLHNQKEYPGTGIGLAICKKVVERHGGRIWVESEPGKGATFRFTLPAVEPHE